MVLLRKVIVSIGLIVGLMLGVTVYPVTAQAATYGQSFDYGVIGDSISEGCVTGGSWCGEFEELLDNSNITHSRYVYAHGGWSCTNLYSHTAELNALLAHDLDVVFVLCGTNDFPAGDVERSNVIVAHRLMAQAINQSGAMVGSAFIQYSDPEVTAKAGKSFMTDGGVSGSEGTVNDLLYVARFGLTPSQQQWFIPIIDLQIVPGNRDYLKEKLPDGRWDGIHPNQLGNSVYARLIYRSTGAAFGFPNNVPQPCGMWGHRTIYNATPWIPCPAPGSAGV